MRQLVTRKLLRGPYQRRISHRSVDLLTGLVGGLLGDLADLAALLPARLTDGVGGASNGVLGGVLGLRDDLLRAGLHLLAGVLGRGPQLLALEVGLRGLRWR